MPRSLRVAAAVLIAALAWGARADSFFSPGDLSNAHAAISGLQNCTKCHPAGKKLSEQRCLDCHTELAPRIDEGKGFHGRMEAKDRVCWKCHQEHQGRDFELIDWGAGGQAKFDHATTGAPLIGKHAQVACEKCHDPQLVRDEDVKELLANHPQRKTWLGAPPMSACASCHFDEHRGQLGTDCKRCHDEKGWRPVPGFNHQRTDYPLTGKHRKVACDKCHTSEEQAGPNFGVLTVPISPDHFARYKPVPHASCLDCHRDPHDGRFGESCARCHTTEDWKKVVSEGAAERAFHEKTRYPLRGGHQFVSCVACHGPFPGQPARFKGLPFGSCTDCHADAHLGQMARRGPANGACERCHDVNGFQPPHFTVEDHAKTAYKLEGAHRVVACAECHPQDRRLAERLPAKIRAELVRRGRPVTLALAVYNVAGNLNRCETCHADPHNGQLQRKDGCAGCHGLDSFRNERFNHDRDSRFALTGKHAKVACAACHATEATPAGPVVRYRPLPITCAGCHADPHAGQFAATAPNPDSRSRSAGGTTDCTRCHGTDDWKATLFRHAPPFTDYQLTGSHADVACKKCHPSVRVTAGVKVQRFRPLPRACESCHADFHKGAFAGFEPNLTAPSPTTSTSRASDTHCDRCHVTERWTQVAFAHERTGFPLRGQHLSVSCKACHATTFTRALGRDCISCHRDVHEGTLGARCSGCHEETNWKSRFDADVHRRSNFPLTGRHALLACEECHGNQLNRVFSRSTPLCFGCHEADYRRTFGTPIDHTVNRFSTQCNQCHQTRRFRGATLPQHDACFLLSSGPHAGISCLGCHTQLAGATITGQCLTGTAACTRCHACSSHPAVQGFACVERKCYECHTFTSGTGSGALRASPLRGRQP